MLPFTSKLLTVDSNLLGQALVALADDMSLADQDDYPAAPVLKDLSRFLFPTETLEGVNAAAGFVFGCLLMSEYLRRTGLDDWPTPAYAVEYVDHIRQ